MLRTLTFLSISLITLNLRLFLMVVCNYRLIKMMMMSFFLSIVITTTATAFLFMMMLIFMIVSIQLILDFYSGFWIVILRNILLVSLRLNIRVVLCVLSLSIKGVDGIICSILIVIPCICSTIVIVIIPIWIVVII